MVNGGQANDRRGMMDACGKSLPCPKHPTMSARSFRACELYFSARNLYSRTRNLYSHTRDLHSRACNECFKN